MKNLSKILFILLTFVFFACENQNTNNNENKDETDTLITEKVEEIEVVEQEVEIKEVESKQMLSIRKGMYLEDIDSEMAGLYEKLYKYAGQKRYLMVGSPIAIWHSWSVNDINDIECGIIINGKIEGSGDIKASETYEGKVAVILHVGSYDSSGESWAKLNEFIEEKGLEKNGNCWDEYITDPRTVKDKNKLKTYLYQPVK